jgi:predicted O-linked N-acetylglucosamine transferase (SPINDLY family)
MASDKDKLLELRKNIFNIVNETPLFDTKKFSQDFFGVLEKI